MNRRNVALYDVSLLRYKNKNTTIATSKIRKHKTFLFTYLTNSPLVFGQYLSFKNFEKSRVFKTTTNLGNPFHDISPREGFTSLNLKIRDWIFSFVKMSLGPKTSKKEIWCNVDSAKGEICLNCYSRLQPSYTYNNRGFVSRRSKLVWNGGGSSTFMISRENEQNIWGTIFFVWQKNLNFEQNTKTFGKGKAEFKGECHGIYPSELSKNAEWKKLETFEKETHTGKETPWNCALH